MLEKKEVSSDAVLLECLDAGHSLICLTLKKNFMSIFEPCKAQCVLNLKIKFITGKV